MGLIGIKPEYRVTANSADITATIADRFISMRVTDETGFQSDTLEIILSDADPENPIQLPPTGAELEIYLGYDGNLTRMGLFVCDELELSGWPGELAIRGRAVAYEKTPLGKTDLQTQKVRSWKNGTTIGAMVAKIAKEHGLQAVVAASLKGIVLPQYDQTEESDISFLIRIAKHYDAIVKPAGGKLAFAKRGESKSAGGEDMPTITVMASECTSWRMHQSTKESPGTVVAYWHNTKQSKRIEVSVGSGDPVKRVKHYFPNQAAALAAANSELDKRKRSENKLSLVMPGNQLLAAEAKLLPSGFHPAVTGDWLITRVAHDLSDSGYKCEIDAERPKGDNELPSDDEE